MVTTKCYVKSKLAEAVADDKVHKCSHVCNGVEPHRMDIEIDYLGEADSTVICEECAKLRDEDEALDKEQCADCKKYFFKGDLTEWVPFDFAPQFGDVPTYVCSTCVNLSKHKKRIENDNLAYIHDVDKYI